MCLVKYGLWKLSHHSIKESQRIAKEGVSNTQAGQIEQSGAGSSRYGIVKVRKQLDHDGHRRKRSVLYAVPELGLLLQKPVHIRLHLFTFEAVFANGHISLSVE